MTFSSTSSQPSLLDITKRPIRSREEELLDSVTPEPAVALAFDPVADLVNEMQRFVKDAVILFHDSHGGSMIAGLFNPLVSTKPRDFRVQVDDVPYDIVPGEKGKRSKVAISRDGLLAGLARIGGDMVQHIEIVKKA